MRFNYLGGLLMLSMIGGFGCDREPAPPALPAATLPATPTSPGAPSPASPSSAAPALAPQADLLPGKPQPTPEDLVRDAELEARVRAKAKELKALSILETRNLAEGADVYVLVRGDKSGGALYGSGPYTADSQIRRAAVHAGALKDQELGILRVRYIKHPGEHPSVPANDIVPARWGTYSVSYTIEKVEIP